jgi:hypothetical protein
MVAGAHLTAAKNPCAIFKRRFGPAYTPPE